MSDRLAAGVTVLGNVSVDLIDDLPPSPGGCPTFAAVALGASDVPGRIVTQMADKDGGLFADLIAGSSTKIDVIGSETTSSFGLRYRGEERALTVESVGPVWDSDVTELAQIRTEWVHIAPLLRQDFPESTLKALAERGHKLSYDGQGLVRTARLGPLHFDGDFPSSLLDHLDVLKLADDEAVVIAGGAFDEDTARQLRVPEILVTHGSSGCDLYLDGRCTSVPVPRRVEEIHTTGAGDMFTTYYVTCRAAGFDGVDSAVRASQFVVDQLTARLAQEGSASR